MADSINFDEARRRLDEALQRIEDGDEDEGTPPSPAASPTVRLPDGDAHPAPRTAERPPTRTRTAPRADERRRRPPAPPPAASQGRQTTEALTRLVVGAAVLGLDALAERAAGWEQQAGIERGEPAAGGVAIDVPIRTPDGARFRHGLIGWVFETEEELRPSGNPLQWLRRVTGHLGGSVFSVVFDSLPRIGPRRRRPAPASDQETERWVERGLREEQRSRAFAAAALDDIVNQAIPYLARQPGVQQAVAELVRSPAMDDAIVTLAHRDGVQQAIADLVRSPAMNDAIVTLARRDGVQQAVAELVRSPLIGDAVTTIVRSPAMDDAVTHLVGTQAMSDAIGTLSKNPALVELVQTQSTSLVTEIVEDVRVQGIRIDDAFEGMARRLLGRRPRTSLPEAYNGLVVTEHGPRAKERAPR
jgi:hypothetical protein